MPAAARKIDLTDRALRALKPAPAGKRITIWDIKKGLAVQVGAKGCPTFFAVYRLKGATQPTWRKLGEYPAMGLAEAREAVEAAVNAMKDGKDPRALAEAKRKAEAEARQEAADNTFGAVAERFIDLYRVTPTKRAGGRPPRRAGDVAAIIRRELVLAWKDRPIAEIAKRDVLRTMQAINTRGGETPAPGSRRRTGGRYAARTAFANARLVFGWAFRNELIPADPCALIDPEKDLHVTPEARDRVLTDDEIRIVWAAAEATPYPYGSLVKLLLLTGARLREVAEASWGEVDLTKARTVPRSPGRRRVKSPGATLTVPTERMKMKIAHVIPLTPAALAIVDGLPRFAGGDYLFSTTGGRRPISGFSKFRAKFNQTLATVAGRDLPAFTIHDLRRTTRTGLSSLGVLKEIAERVIGHLPQGIEATYDLHRYDKEKRAALAKWEKHLLTIVAPEPPAEVDNVVPMRKRV
jgi:integrase